MLLDVIVSNLSILVVDDEREMGEILEIALKAEGHHAVRCRSGVEAAQKLQNAPEAFNLVITDHYMPGSYSGAGLARVIRAKQMETEVLVISGRMSQEVTDEYQPYSVLGFLPKPIDLDELGGFLQLVEIA